ncbi:MAG: protein phosphatase 2C domain-containing protein [Paracoccus sp. (in: a-proteobacteria)]|uniref:PP2C family protein-serine/threonine phosphatase n=1 Tax=Paracoccus sp. TaxID=267 RepID=UPI0026DF043C|nr:protein phosphatase 2C domain-containing protein [Paracoccus sp. (in: a-proteobacteria)]MDO5612956.1 protein phosphatase 2C domain-containing protein [Paracoccus sp. (in: a-proteobacteria)]
MILPLPPFRYDTGTASDTGLVRAHNEDSLLSLPAAGVWMVADGMGGHDAGDVAAAIIAEEIESVGIAVSTQDQRARVAERLGRAHHRITAHSREMGLATVGATVAALLIFETGFACLWAGDSRIYLLRAGRLSRLTTDHSEVQELIDAGRLTAQQARTWPRRNVITRAIGIHDGPHLETVTGMVMPGDVFLLCTDGLTEHLPDPDLTALLAGQGSAQAVADALIAETLQRGARDNVTTIVLRCLPTDDEAGDQP